jgi:hypothetical protein
MTQPLASDFPIDPTTTSGTALADILNRFSDSVGTSNAGATAPPDTMPGMIWLDTSGGGNGVLKIRNAANTGWITISDTSGAVKLADGTVAAPGLAWASEPGLGWYRPSPGVIAMVASGAFTSFLSSSSATSTVLGLYPRATGASFVTLLNQPNGSANYNSLQLSQLSTGGGVLATGATGSATRGDLTLDAPNVISPNGFSVVTGFTMRIDGLVRRLQFSGTAWEWNWNQSTGRLGWRGNSAETFWLDAGGAEAGFQLTNVYKVGGGPFLATADVRIKDVAGDYEAGLEAVLALRPRRYTYKQGSEHDTAIQYIGLVAQEAEQAMPELVKSGGGKAGEFEFEDMRSLDAGPVTWALVNAIKTLNDRIVKLETA